MTDARLSGQRLRAERKQCRSVHHSSRARRRYPRCCPRWSTCMCWTTPRTFPATGPSSSTAQTSKTHLASRGAIIQRTTRGHSQNLSRPNSKKQKAHSKVSMRSLKCALKLAEWTGLEPATPGVTGRSQKPMNTPVLAILDIPKSPTMAQHSCGAGWGDSKVFNHEGVI